MATDDEKKIGFARLSPEAARENASRAASIGQRMGRLHQWNREEAAAAGRRSAELRRARRQSDANAQELL